MRRVPFCLFFAAFVLALPILASEGARAEPRLSHGFAGHHGAWGGHRGFSNGSWSRPHGSLFRQRGYAHRAPAFHRNSYFYSRGYQRFGGFGYPHSVYGRAGYGRHGYGGFNHGRYGYGYHGYGRHFYGRQGPWYYGYGHPGYGGRGFFPHSTWLWPSSYSDGDVTPSTVEPADAPSVPPGIPSVADLPVSTGIRSTPAAAPAVYVLSAKGSARSGTGAKIVTMDRSESQDEGEGTSPRIIHLDVPRGR
jgi:hypothetical protein